MNPSAYDRLMKYLPSASSGDTPTEFPVQITPDDNLYDILNELDKDLKENTLPNGFRNYSDSVAYRAGSYATNENGDIQMFQMNIIKNMYGYSVQYHPINRNVIFARAKRVDDLLAIEHY